MWSGFPGCGTSLCWTPSATSQGCSLCELVHWGSGSDTDGWSQLLSPPQAFAFTQEIHLDGFAGGKTLRMNQDVTGGPVKKCVNEKISVHVKK